MTELERQLMKALKEWGEQYEQGQTQQAEQVEALARQVNDLGEQVETLASQYEQGQTQQATQVEALAGQVNNLAMQYKRDQNLQDGYTETLRKQIFTLTQTYNTLVDLLRVR